MEADRVDPEVQDFSGDHVDAGFEPLRIARDSSPEIAVAARLIVEAVDIIQRVGFRQLAILM
jgi:hypothetical protein